MRDLKNLGRDVPTLKSQVLLTVCAFGLGVLVNQHFTDKALADAHKAHRAAMTRSVEYCTALNQAATTYTEELPQ